MIEVIIESLEKLSRNDLRNVSNNNFEVSGILAMSSPDVLKFCNNNYDHYFRLQIQLSKIYIFDLKIRDFAEAISIHNNLLQLIEFDCSYVKYKFDILYLKTLVYHFSRNEEKAFTLAKQIHQEYYRQGENEVRVLIDKLLALTTPDIEEAISHSKRALQYFENTTGEVTERGWIYKNLAFYYLKIGELSLSLINLKKFMKISMSMDEPESFPILVLSGYIEMLSQDNIQTKSGLNPSDIDRLKDEIDKQVTDVKTLTKNIDNLISLISDASKYIEVE